MDSNIFDTTADEFAKLMTQTWDKTVDQGKVVELSGGKKFLAWVAHSILNLAPVQYFRGDNNAIRFQVLKQGLLDNLGSKIDSAEFTDLTARLGGNLGKAGSTATWKQQADIARKTILLARDKIEAEQRLKQAGVSVSELQSRVQQIKEGEEDGLIRDIEEVRAQIPIHLPHLLEIEYRKEMDNLKKRANDIKSIAEQLLVVPKLLKDVMALQKASYESGELLTLKARYLVLKNQFDLIAKQPAELTIEMEELEASLRDAFVRAEARDLPERVSRQKEGIRVDQPFDSDSIRKELVALREKVVQLSDKWNDAAGDTPFDKVVKDAMLQKIERLTSEIQVGMDDVDRALGVQGHIEKLSAPAPDQTLEKSIADVEKARGYLAILNAAPLHFKQALEPAIEKAEKGIKDVIQALEVRVQGLQTDLARATTEQQLAGLKGRYRQLIKDVDTLPKGSAVQGSLKSYLKEINAGIQAARGRLDEAKKIEELITRYRRNETIQNLASTILQARTIRGDQTKILALQQEQVGQWISKVSGLKETPLKSGEIDKRLGQLQTLIKIRSQNSLVFEGVEVDGQKAPAIVQQETEEVLKTALQKSMNAEIEALSAVVERQNFKVGSQKIEDQRTQADRLFELAQKYGVSLPRINEVRKKLSDQRIVAHAEEGLLALEKGADVGGIQPKYLKTTINALFRHLQQNQDVLKAAKEFSWNEANTRLEAVKDKLGRSDQDETLLPLLAFVLKMLQPR